MPDGGTAGDGTESVPTAPLAPTTSGGDGRVTVAVPGPRAVDLLSVDRGRVLVRPRGSRREFELLSTLRRSAVQIARVTVRADGPLAGSTIADVSAQPEGRVLVGAMRSVRGTAPRRHWAISPSPTTTVTAGDELFVIGRRSDLAALEGGSQ